MWQDNGQHEERMSNNNHDGEDEISYASEQSSDLRGREIGGYVDQYGNPNPDYSGNGIGIEAILEEQRIENSRRLAICTDFLADVSFFFGSTMYLWLALSQGRNALLGISSNAADTNPTSEETQSDDLDWNMVFSPASNKKNFGDSAWFLEDQVVFSFDEGNSLVTLYIMYGFSAALLVFATGFLRLFTTTGKWSDRVPSAIMCLASIFAMTSSALVESNPFWSDVCYSVGIHLFAFHAATLVLWRSTALGHGILWARLVADALFFFATLGGIALSYLFLFDAADRLPFPYEYLSMGSYGFWWLASVVYLLQTLCTLVCARRRQRRQLDEDSEYSRGRGCYCSCLRRKNEDSFEDEHEYDEGGYQNKSLPQKDTESTKEEDDTDEEEANRPAAHVVEGAHRTDVGKHRGKAKLDGDIDEEEESSVFTLWTSGPVKSSLDDIFGSR